MRCTVRHNGRSGNAPSLIVGGVGFCLVLGMAWYFLAAPPPRAVPELPVAAMPAPATFPTVTTATTPASEPVIAAAPQASPVVVEPRKAPVELTREEIVQAHLAAGEFGPALDAAASAPTPEGQAALIRAVAQAQVAAGEFHAARATLKRLPPGDARSEDQAALAEQQALAGGFGADFTQLIDLIQNETGNEDYGPWVDIHGTGGTVSQFDSGVRVDPRGVLALASARETDGRLAALSDRVRTAALNDDLARTSGLRIVSLTRLERAIADRLAAGKPVVESMRQLAGLTSVEYVFVYPDTGDVVIAGPAEGWRYDERGRAVGRESGRPTLPLDDLVTLLRTFSREGMNVFGCSIDPRPENLQALRDFVAQSQARGPLPAGGAARWARQLQEKLGLQQVTIYGVPPDSRVARVIVEADYRMKLIGIGRLDAGSQIPNYFTLLAQHPEQASSRIDGLRWWLTLECRQVRHSDSRTAFEIHGSSVRCLSENEFLDQQGQRVHTGESEPANRLFAARFTEHYAELARREPIFADLQGVFDLALAAALIQTEGLDQAAGWDRGVFRTDGGYLPTRYPVPREVETAVNHRVFRGTDVVVQVAGGVKGDVAGLLRQSELRQANPRLDGVARHSRAGELPAGRWWWDAE
jgi:hypothetical protein